MKKIIEFVFYSFLGIIITGLFSLAIVNIIPVPLSLEKIMGFLFFNNKPVAALLLIFLTLLTTVLILFLIKINEKDSFSLQAAPDYNAALKKENLDFTLTFEKLINSLGHSINSIKDYSKVLDEEENIIKLDHLESFKNEVEERLIQQLMTYHTELTGCHTLKELFDLLLNWATQLTQSQRGSIMLLNSNRELYIYKTLGWTEAEKMNFISEKVPVGVGIAGIAAAENRRIFVSNIENDAQFKNEERENYNKKSFMSLPIQGEKSVIGVLNLTDTKADKYSLYHLELINFLVLLNSFMIRIIQSQKKDKINV